MTNYIFATGHKNFLKPHACGRRYWVYRQFTPYCAQKPKRFAVKFKDPSRETYRALCLSMGKWWRIAFGGCHDHSWRDCSLCALFIDQLYECHGCPIAHTQSEIGCCGTPYIGYNALADIDETHPRAIEKAQDFYYWLQDLRDEYRDQLEGSGK